SGKSRLATGVGFGILSAAAFGFSLVALDEGANADPYWATLVLRAASSIAIVATVLALRKPVRAPRRFWPVLVVIGFLDVGGTVFCSRTRTRALISVVSALISFVPVFVALLARIFLNERLQRIQVAGAAMAILGVTCIAAGG